LNGKGIPAAEMTRVEQAAEAFGKAMFTDADFGLLLRLVAAEIDDQQNTNCERYISDAAAAAFARQMSRLRTVQRKLRRQREALRASRTAEPGPPDPQDADDEAVAARPGPVPREPARPEDAVGFLALGATERVMTLLRSETTHETISGLARRAQVSRTTVANVIRPLDHDGQLDVAGAPGRTAYLLKPEARA
jgi:hypothetical protein